MEEPPKDKKKREKLVKALTEAIKEVYGHTENSAQITVLEKENTLKISNTITEQLTEKSKT